MGENVHRVYWKHYETCIEKVKLQLYTQRTGVNVHRVQWKHLPNVVENLHNFLETFNQCNARLARKSVKY
jgi:hypothetical protein